MVGFALQLGWASSRTGDWLVLLRSGMGSPCRRHGFFYDLRTARLAKAAGVANAAGAMNAAEDHGHD